MFHGKCAYCESKLTHVTYGDIEHFRPKGNPHYRHLTFNWDNLLLSCPICNDAAHKGSHFPLDTRGDPVLLDPTDKLTDPNHHLRFVWDPATRLAMIVGTDARGREVERVFDLNGAQGRKELIRQRSKHVRKLLALRKMADAGNREAQSILDEDCKPSAEYLAFAHTLVCP